ALGDAVGYPCEFRRRDRILEVFPPDGVTGPVASKDPIWGQKPFIVGANHPPGTFTDDTQMTIAVALGLIEAGRGSLDALMQIIGKHFVAWSRSDDNNRSPGATCMTGCRNLGRGAPWREAGVADSKGCGSNMRVAPIGLYYAERRDELLEVARASSVLTHGHDAAIEGAAAAALLVAMALDGASFEDMHTEVTRVCRGRSPDFDDCWARVPELLSADPGVALAEGGLGESWVAEEAVASALWCVWRAEGDYRKAVLLAANTDGDSDSIACIAGGIAGAMGGTAALPAEWLEVLEKREELTALADELYRASL
ncbi:MAG: ADP-ribosylglycohydrolase family protein, partial [Deltaproteobacteria bacterium]|nr:ADP-ribosylglycohydrolase family protein [Deltaproteobacteria bacterium]